MSTPLSSPVARPRAAVVGGVLAVLLSAAACAPADVDGAEAPGVVGVERELTFEGGGHEVSASFRAPHGASERLPGALIISGSGPTDRDGNAPARPDADTNQNLSRVLADAGVASLRYDKFGSGPDPQVEEETGPGGVRRITPVDPEVFDRQVVAAYEELLAQPEVDPRRVVVVGHSEGALYALRAHRLIGSGHPSPALVLAAPPGTRYLDLLDRQVTEQVRLAEGTGQLGESEAVRILSDMRAGRAAIRGGRDITSQDSDQLGIYTPWNAEFLSYMDGLDPVELGRDLPEGTPVLVLWGEDDAQVSRGDVDRLMTGLDGAERVDLPGTDHILRAFEDEPGAAVLDTDRPFAEGVSPALEEFLGNAW